VETTTALAIFFSPLLLPPRSTLFPYTTLFRSDLVPTARVAHIGLYREPQTFVAVEYFFKSPSDLHERLAIVVSPVLATANTAVRSEEHTLNSSHVSSSYAVFCLKKKKQASSCS